MTDKEALQAVARGEQLPQEIVRRRLWWEGLIEIEDATKPDSLARQYVAKFVTPRGRQLMSE
jgi:hypothetical protein